MVKTEIVIFFVNINQTTKTFNQSEVTNLRHKIIANLPIVAIKYIKPGGILDIAKPYTFKNSDGDLYQLIKPVDDFLTTDIPDLIKTINSKSDPTFKNEAHLSTIKKIYGKTVHKNIQKINTDDLFAVDVFSGKVNIGTGDTLQRLSRIENIDKKIITQYIENIDNLISLAKEWESSMSFDTQIAIDLQRIKAKYQSIDYEIDAIRSHLDGVVTGSLVEEILSSFELKVDSDIIDLETSARAYVGADVGAMMVNLTGKPDSYRVLPYVGVNLYIAPVNKRAPLKRLSHTYKGKVIWRMLSIHAGVTIPTMTSTDYQGIFNLQDPKGFMVGIGIRPYRALKLSIGGLLQNRANGNPLNDSFHIALRPYASVSLDWEVRNIIPDIKSLFTK